MSKGNKRSKLAEERARKKAAKFANYDRGDMPSEVSSYGKRWWARRRGQPMAARPIPPWWTSYGFLEFRERDFRDRDFKRRAA